VHLRHWLSSQKDLRHRVWLARSKHVPRDFVLLAMLVSFQARRMMRVTPRQGRPQVRTCIRSRSGGAFGPRAVRCPGDLTSAQGVRIAVPECAAAVYGWQRRTIEPQHEPEALGERVKRSGEPASFRLSVLYHPSHDKCAFLVTNDRRQPFGGASTAGAEIGRALSGRPPGVIASRRNSIIPASRVISLSLHDPLRLREFGEAPALRSKAAH